MFQFNNKITKHRNNEEEKIQNAVVKYLTLSRILFFAIPNGEKRDIITAKRLVGQGVRAGVPDLFICEPTKHYSGLFIELKTSKGQTTQEQRVWKDKLSKKGYLSVVTRRFNITKDIIDAYLNNKIIIDKKSFKEGDDFLAEYAIIDCDFDYIKVDYKKRGGSIDIIDTECTVLPKATLFTEYHKGLAESLVKELNKKIKDRDFEVIKIKQGV